MVPTRMRGTSAASALSELHASSIAPSRSLVFGRKWSVTQPMSQPVASMCFQRSSTPGQVCIPMLVNRPKRISSPPGSAREGPAGVGGGDLDLRQLQLAPDDVRAEVDGDGLVEGDTAGQSLAAEAAVAGEDQPLDRHV